MKILVLNCGSSSLKFQVIDMENEERLIKGNYENIGGKRACLRFNVKGEKFEFETLCILRIGIGMEANGYLICAEARNRRIWQEAECAIVYFLAKMVAASIRINGEGLDQEAEQWQAIRRDWQLPISAEDPADGRGALWAISFTRKTFREKSGFTI